jgi:tetratricopeptide (TPR) repeat protein
MAQTLPDSVLERAVERYEKAIASLEAAAEDLSVEHVLDVLIARDAVQVAMSDKTQHHSGRLVKAVKELDNRLKEQARYINRVTRLAEWQAIFNPPEKEWWWLLDPITPKPWRDQFDWLWRFFSLIFLTASLSLLIDISTRFLSGGPDTAGVFAVIIPSVLTLLAGGGALTKTGQEGLEYILTSFKLEKAWWDEIVCLGSALLLVFLMGFWSLLPILSDRYYVNIGNKAYDAGQITMAEENYNRALKLNPDSTKAHYQLGKIHEELRDLNEAKTHYKIAAKGGITAAYNDLVSVSIGQKDYTEAGEWLAKCQEQAKGNQKKLCTALDKLVRAYIKEKNYAEAVRWARVGVADWWADSKMPLVGLTPEEYKLRQYNILTYLGWALLNQKNYSEAKMQLEKAQKLATEKAPAYCLLAQVLEKQNNPLRASAAWEQCLQYGSLIDPDEGYWISMARQRIAAKGEQK